MRRERAARRSRYSARGPLTFRVGFEMSPEFGDPNGVESVKQLPDWSDPIRHGPNTGTLGRYPGSDIRSGSRLLAPIGCQSSANFSPLLLRLIGLDQSPYVLETERRPRNTLVVLTDESHARPHRVSRNLIFDFRTTNSVLLASKHPGSKGHHLKCTVVYESGCERPNRETPIFVCFDFSSRRKHRIRMSDFRWRSVVDGAQLFGQLFAMKRHPGVLLHEQANREPSNPCPSEICQILRHLLPILTR